jgi:thiamine pyrophosphate-dependent acetolactate synthase large subunit-like protein
MGAKLAYPERMVVNVIGDAGIGMVGMDLETAVRNKIAITTIHINNEGFYYYKQFPKKVVNMTKVAEGWSEYTERIEKPDEIIPAIKRAFKENKAGRPAYLEVMCVQNRDYPSWIQP